MHNSKLVKSSKLEGDSRGLEGYAMLNSDEDQFPLRTHLLSTDASNNAFLNVLFVLQLCY